MREHASKFGTKPFSESSREIARAVIVDGDPAIDVAKAHGVSRQRVSQVVARYFEELLDTPNLRETTVYWVKHGFELPAQLKEPLEKFLATARCSNDTKKVQSTLRALIAFLETRTEKLE